MPVDSEEVRKVAHLARIAVKDSELPALAEELSGILAWIEQLFEVDVEGVEPISAATDMQLPMREQDRALPTSRDDILANAPAIQDGFYTVPKVVE